jgi:hypothetical protein
MGFDVTGDDPLEHVLQVFERVEAVHPGTLAERRTMPSGAVRAGRGGVAVPPARCSALLSLGIV